jgi:hypothetical protein
VSVRGSRARRTLWVWLFASLVLALMPSASGQTDAAFVTALRQTGSQGDLVEVRGSPGGMVAISLDVGFQMDGPIVCSSTSFIWTEPNFSREYSNGPAAFFDANVSARVYFGPYTGAYPQGTTMEWRPGPTVHFGVPADAVEDLHWEIYARVGEPHPGCYGANVEPGIGVPPLPALPRPLNVTIHVEEAASAGPDSPREQSSPSASLVLVAAALSIAFVGRRR